RREGPPPRLGVLLGAAGRRVGLGPVAGAGEAQQTPVERDEAGLHLGCPEIDAEDRGLARRSCHAAPPRASLATASAVVTSVTSVVTAPDLSAPRLGRALAAAPATPIRTGTRSSRSTSNAIVRSSRSPRMNVPSTSNGAISSSPTASAFSSRWQVAFPNAADVQAGPPMPKTATSSRSH